VFDGRNLSVPPIAEAEIAPISLSAAVLTRSSMAAGVTGSAFLAKNSGPETVFMHSPERHCRQRSAD